MIKVAWAVNFHKIVTLFLILAMMAWFENYSTAAWVYLALHGTYGYCWLIKDQTSRDQQFDTRMTYGGVLMLYVGLIAWYWVIPYLLISRGVKPSDFILWWAITMHTLGVALMLAADLQKNLTLQFRKGLITTGTFRYTRNPNYLGEILIYSSYALLAAHWFAWLIVAYMTFGMSLVRMLIKDARMSRHPGWQEYTSRTGLVLPTGIFKKGGAPTQPGSAAPAGKT